MGDLLEYSLIKKDSSILSKYNHQEIAITQTVEYFSDNSNTRGKVIMPCGSGKSLTAFWIMQEMRLLKNVNRTIITVPNLILQGQIFKTFYYPLSETHNFICVGSDKDIATNFDNNEIAVTTKESEIKSFLKNNKNKQIVVIATYQSLIKFSEICNKVGFDFDFGIIDESHRTVGNKEKCFSTILFDEEIKIKRRLFMTATEKIYSGKNDEVIGMNNKDYYGESIYEYTLQQAIKDEILCDYKISSIYSTSDEITEFINSNKYINTVELDLSPADYKKMMSSVLATITTIRTKGCKKIVTYHSTIKKAQIFKQLLDAVITNNLLNVGTFHVNGKQNSKERRKNMEGFENANIAVLTNSQALVEGIDIPCIDCIVFADKREGAIGIIQAVGRALRKFKGKTESYIVIPVLAESIENIDVENSEFSGLFNILMTLGIMDERVLHEIKYFNIEGNGSSTNKIISTIINPEIDKQFKDKINELIDKVFLRVYKRVNWKHFLGMKEAMEWIKKSKFKDIKTPNEWDNIKMELPPFIPKYPYDYYKSTGEWVGWRFFLGTEKFTIEQAMEWKENSEFRDIRTKDIWLSKSHKFPPNMPKNPAEYYTNLGTWKGWAYFLGKKKKYYLTFEEASEWIWNSEFKGISSKKWSSISGKLPDFIPKAPYEHYRKIGTWKGWAYFTGKEVKVKVNKKPKKKRVGILSMEVAMEWIENSEFKHIKTEDEWKKIKKQLPDFISKDPRTYYTRTGEWKGWIYFLGTKIRQFLSMKEAMEWKENSEFKNIKTPKEWYGITKKLPPFIPKEPCGYYKRTGEWAGWRIFLGTDRFTIEQAMEWKENSEFKDIKTQKEWSKITKHLPLRMPKNTSSYYTRMGTWKGWAYFLRKEEGRYFKRKKK